MEERHKSKNLAERLYHLNVLPIENLRGSDAPDVVMMNIHDKSEENTISTEEDDPENTSES